MPTHEEVLARLEQVVDPCSLAMGGRRDIRRLGLVERVDVAGTTVRVEIVLTDASCVFWAGIRQSIVDAVGSLPEVDRVDVTLSRTGVWTPARMRSPLGAPSG